MSDTGLPDGAYGGLLALGSIEHTAEGPRKALAEFYRLLRPGGVAVITVPHGGWPRRWCRAVSRPYEAAKGVRLLRRLTGKRPLASDARSRRAARRGTVADRHPQFALNADVWSYYENEFNRQQLDRFPRDAGFAISDSFAAFAEEGPFHTFGRLAGRWNGEESRVDLTAPGRLLCYVVTRPAGK